MKVTKKENTGHERWRCERYYSPVNFKWLLPLVVTNHIFLFLSWYKVCPIHWQMPNKYFLLNLIQIWQTSTLIVIMSTIFQYIQQDATLNRFIISGNCSTCFGWYLHPSSGAHTTVFTASGICHTVTATCRYRGRVGTSYEMLYIQLYALLIVGGVTNQNM